MKIQIERQEQIWFVSWFKCKYPQYELLIHHSPNGGYRRPVEAKYFKAMGTQPGRPDIEINVPKGSYAGLFIEMKRTPSKNTKAQKGRLSALQKKQLEALFDAGYRVAIANGLEEAKTITREYLESVEESQ